jgi:hypothetical protein
MHYGETVITLFVGRIDGFHTHIESQDEVIEIQA